MRRLYYLLLLGVVVVIFRYTILPYLIAETVCAIFAHGSKTEVSYGGVDFSLFPLEATLHKVSIQPPHASKSAFTPEAGGQEMGILLESVSTNLVLSKLWHRSIYLEKVTVQVATISSVGEDSAFFRFLDFLFRDSEKESKWKVQVEEVILQPLNASIPSLKMEVQGNELAFYQVAMKFVRRMGSRDGQFDFEASASRPKWARAKGMGLGFANIKIAGMVGEGIMRFREIKFNGKDSSRQSHLEGAGLIDFNREGRYDLHFNSRIGLDASSGLTSELRQKLSALAVELSGDCDVTGALNAPVVSWNGKLSTVLGIQESACRKLSLPYLLTLNKDRLEVVVSSTQLAEAQGKLDLEFKGEMPISLELRATIGGDEASRFCIDRTETVLREQFASSDGDEQWVRALISRWSGVKIEGKLQGALAQSTQTTAEYEGQINVLSRLVGQSDSSSIMASFSQHESRFVAKVLQTSEHHPEENTLGFEVSYEPALQEMFVNNITASRYHPARALSLARLFVTDNQTLEIFQGAVDESTTLKVLPGGSFSVMQGSLETAQLKIEAEGIKLGEKKLNSIALEIQKERDLWKASPIRIRMDSSVLEGRLEKTTDKGFIGQLKTEALLLKELVSSGIPEIDALSLRGSVLISGDIYEPILEGRVSVFGPLSGSQIQELGSLEFDNRNKGYRGALKSEVLNLVSDVSLSNFERNAEVTLNVRAKDTPYGWLLRRGIDRNLVEDAFKFSGGLDYRFRLSQPAEGVGQLKVERLSAEAESYQVVSKAPFVINLNKGKFSLDGLVLQSKGFESSVKGEVDLKSGWSMAASGVTMVDEVLLPIAGIQELGGQLETYLVIRGALNTPVLSGTVQFKQGHVSFPLGAELIHLERINLKLECLDQGYCYVKGGASLGGGTIEVTQEITGLTSGNLQFDTTLDYSKVTVRPLKNLEIQTNGALHFKGDLKTGSTLGGQVDVSSLTYEDSTTAGRVMQWLLKTIAEPSRIQRVVVTPPRRHHWPESVRLDLKLRTTGPVQVNTDLIRSELSANMGVLGTMADPRLTGSVDVLSGAFGLRSGQFKVVEGKVLYLPESELLDPEVRLLAEAPVINRRGDTGYVQLLVRGTVSQAIVQMSSDLGGSPKDILEYLGVGAAGEEFRIVKDSGRKLPLRDLLDLRSSATVEERITGITGINEIAIDPDYQGEKIGLNPKVIARRPLLGKSELVIESGLGESRERKVRAEYPLTQRLGVIAEWHQGAVNDPKSSSASIGFGIQYKKNCSGTTLLRCE